MNVHVAIFKRAIKWVCVCVCIWQLICQRCHWIRSKIKQKNLWTNCCCPLHGPTNNFMTFSVDVLTLILSSECCIMMFIYIARPTYCFILMYICGLTVVIKRMCYVMVVSVKDIVIWLKLLIQLLQWSKVPTVYAMFLQVTNDSNLRFFDQYLLCCITVQRWPVVTYVPWSLCLCVSVC